jgi:glycosyltransferase involved in cell wall biosynthesis
VQVTIILPYYRQPAMLARQLQEFAQYPAGIRLVVVDDGSPEPAEAVIREHPEPRLALYRIGVDVPWNRGEARNLGATVAETDWILHMDIDHVLPVESAHALLALEPEPRKWYRFKRFRVGKADDTRNKDALPRDAEFGEVKPHGDSYLVTKALYWKAGGYNLAFSGCLGGGSPFLQELAKEGPVEVLPIPLHVHTRSSVPDSSDWSLSRDTSEYARRKAAMRGNYRGTEPLRSPWSRVL